MNDRLLWCLDELSRCYAMLAVVLRRKGGNLQQDQHDAGLYWDRIHAAHDEMHAMVAREKASGEGRG